MPQVLGEDPFEVARVPDQDPDHALGPNGSHPANWAAKSANFGRTRAAGLVFGQGSLRPRPLPDGAGALKSLYLVTRSLDPTGVGRIRWTMRWKPAINAFAITFGDRFPAAETR
jgi:hypothetical protein